MAKVRPDLTIERLLQNEVITFSDLRANHLEGTLSEFLSYYRVGGSDVEESEDWTFEQMFEDDALTDEIIRERLEEWLEIINEIKR
jgi:hypothetical protein